MSHKTNDVLSMEKLVNMWKRNKITHMDIQGYWEEHWDNKDQFIKIAGISLISVVKEIISCDDEVELYFDLKTMQIIGPFEYKNIEHQKEVQQYRESTNHICIFEK